MEFCDGASASRSMDDRRSAFRCDCARQPSSHFFGGDGTEIEFNCAVTSFAGLKRKNYRQSAEEEERRGDGRPILLYAEFIWAFSVIRGLCFICLLLSSSRCANDNDIPPLPLLTALETYPPLRCNKHTYLRRRADVHHPCEHIALPLGPALLSSSSFALECEGTHRRESAQSNIRLLLLTPG